MPGVKERHGGEERKSRRGISGNKGISVKRRKINEKKSDVQS